MIAVTSVTTSTHARPPLTSATVPEVGNLRGGLVAAGSTGTFAIVSGGVACVAVVALIAATTPGLRRFRV